MPAPRAVLADITDFKLDPKTPHTVVRAHGRLSSYTKNDASATSTVYVPVPAEPEPTVEDVAPPEVLSTVSAEVPLEWEQPEVELETVHHLPLVSEEHVVEPVVEEPVEAHVDDVDVNAEMAAPQPKKRGKKSSERR